MGFHRQRTMWLWRNPDNVTHRQLLSIDQVWRRSCALTWSRWGCRRLADNIWLLAHDNNNNCPHHWLHHFDFSCSFYISVFPNTGHYNSLLSSQCYASFNFFCAISICWLVWSQEFKVVHLLQWFSFMVHLHWNIVLSADHHCLSLLSENHLLSFAIHISASNIRLWIILPCINELVSSAYSLRGIWV